MFHVTSDYTLYREIVATGFSNQYALCQAVIESPVCECSLLFVDNHFESNVKRKQ